MLFFNNSLLIFIFFLHCAAVPCLVTSLQHDYEVQQQQEKILKGLKYDGNDNGIELTEELSLELPTESTPTKNRIADCYREEAVAVNGNSPSERAIPFENDIFICLLCHKKDLAATWSSFTNVKQLKQRTKLKRRKCNQKEINFRLAYNPLPEFSRKVQLNDLIMREKFKSKYDLFMNLADEDQDKVEQQTNEQRFLNEFKSSQELRRKREPISISIAEDGPLFKAPHYPYAFAPYYSYRNNKREITDIPNFIPSISAGSMTNLGHFFKDLSKNVKFSEKLLLGNDERKLLQGDHPLRVLHEQMSENEPNTMKTSEFLQAIRSYRPSQKIRSLVAMSPEGYRGSHLIDPNYMWVGLGK